jgi:protein-tyrosine phosphatase
VSDIFWIGNTGLAIVMRPRGDNALQLELKTISNAGIQILVSALENWETRELGLAEERKYAEHFGIHFISYPLEDQSTPPDREEFEELVKDLANRLRHGQKIGVHCRGCIGRSTVIAACTLIQSGWPAKRAVDAIEEARGCSVPDTEEQLEWIIAFGESE